MKNTNLSDRIEQTFIENNNTPLSYNELVNELHLVRREKSLLAETLQAMVAEGILTKKTRKFRLAVSPDQLKKETYEPVSHPRLLEGIFDATPLARDLSYAFVRTEKGDFYINSEDTLNAYHNDIVAIEPHFRKGKPDYAIVRKIIKRANEIMTGDIRKSGSRTFFISINPKIHNWIEVSDLNGAKEGDKVVLEVTNWGNQIMGRMPVGKVIEILGPSGDPEVELLAVIRQYNLPLQFPDTVISEMEAIEESISDKELAHRLDLRNILTFTIDPASAKDFDDAISLERINQGWRLYVHIADVAHYVKPESATFSEAVKRGNSFYFPKKVIPMLPEKLSNKVCSLRPNEDKLAMSVITDFNLQGRIMRQRLEESVIRSDYRLNYDQVDELFSGKNTDFPSDLSETLLSARKLSSLLTAKRLKEGYIFFDLPELEYEYDEEGFLKRFTLAEETESHKLIENFMLVANECIATKLSKLAPATIYRIHEDPDWEKIERLIELLSYYGISFYERENLNASIQYLLHSLPTPEHHKVFEPIILRSMKKAKYSTEHIRHFGLGMETYTHFTSPIRRLCDLVIHHLSKTYILKTSKIQFDYSQLKHFASVASEQELQADQSERDIEHYFSMTYMKKFIGESFSGIVMSAKNDRLIIRLDQIPINAVLMVTEFPPGNWIFLDRQMRFINEDNRDYFQLMDKVLVNIMEVSDDIYLELKPGKESHRHFQFQLSNKNSFNNDNRIRKSQRGKKRFDVDYKFRNKNYGNTNKRYRGK